jgi:F-type H+-transporting ATPase subunit b
MKTQKMKRILPLLLAALLYAVPTGAAFAAEHGEADTAAATMEHQPAVAEHDSGAHAASEHEAAMHDEGHGEAGHHAAPMITGAKLKDLLWRVMNFAALVFILVKFGGRPVARYFDDRRRAIADELKNMEARRDEAEQACKAFEARLAGMEDEIALTVERAVASAAKEKERILAEAEQAAQEIRRQAEAAVQAAVAAAQRGLQEEVAEQAAAMAEQLIVKSLTPTDHVAIIEQYLDKTGRAAQ